MDHITKHMGDMLWCKGNYLLYFVSLIQMCYDGVMCGQGFPRGTHLWRSQVPGGDDEIPSLHGWVTEFNAYAV